jgi:hypothetical protein
MIKRFQRHNRHYQGVAERKIVHINVMSCFALAG